MRLLLRHTNFIHTTHKLLHKDIRTSVRRAPADCWYPSQLQIENHTNVNTPHYTYPVQPKTCQLVPARQYLSPGILSGDRWGGARGEGSYLISSTATYRSERCTVLVCFDYRYCFTCLSTSLSARSPSSKLLDVGKRPCAKSKYCKGCYRHPAERNVKTLAKHSSWSEEYKMQYVKPAQLAEVSRPPMAERVVVLPAAQTAAPLCKSKSFSLIFRVTICDVRFHG